MVAEISLALVLLVGAGLLLRSFFRVLEADGGFRTQGVLTAAVPLPQTRFDDHAKRAAFLERVLEGVRALPGVKTASATLPLLGGWQSSFSVEGKPEPPPGQRPSADIARVTPDYFGAMGVRVARGPGVHRARPDRRAAASAWWTRPSWPSTFPPRTRSGSG